MPPQQLTRLGAERLSPLLGSIVSNIPTFSKQNPQGVSLWQSNGFAYYYIIYIEGGDEIISPA
jgi:hypothetical protein